MKIDAKLLALAGILVTLTSISVLWLLLRMQEPAPMPSPESWVIPAGAETPLRAVHLGGNWGTTRDNANANNYPDEYFAYLRDLAVSWVGISVALHVDDSLDSSVERKYEGVDNPSFTDDELSMLIGKLHQYGFQVYLTLAIEDSDSGKAAKPVERWQLGDPNIHTAQGTKIKAADWPWRVKHPRHEQFVAAFWQSYTDRAVEVGQLAQELGVAMYSLGTETEALFRTRSGGEWPNHYLAELNTLVSQVRNVYTGTLTYDMSYEATSTENTFYQPGSEHLWEDLNLDAVGISAYFPLVDKEPTTVRSVADFEQSWETIFTRNLQPIKDRNPTRPIYFLEFGYVDTVESPLDPARGELIERAYLDTDENDKDDGQEQQANIYQAFFNIINKHAGLVEGAFLWDTQLTTRHQWQEFFVKRRTFSIRQKLAEDVVRTTYTKWRDGQ